MKVFLFSLFFSICGFAQMPETDIWLVKIEKTKGVYYYKNPFNITNYKGYDNQPCFSSDNKSIYFVSVKEDNQADIYSYNIKPKKIVRFTNTKTSEYSPTLTPDKKFISTVTVEIDSAQRVWSFPILGGQSDLLIPQIDSVGYFTWLNKDTVLYYKLTNRHSLRALDIKTNKDVWICDYPTRAFKKIGNTSQFIYGIKKDTTYVEFRIYNPILRESVVYANYPSINEDFIWHNDLGLIKSENADLLRYNPLTKTWEVLFSFSNLGIKKITRFIFDSKTKQLVVVSNL